MLPRQLPYTVSTCFVGISIYSWYEKIYGMHFTICTILQITENMLWTSMIRDHGYASYSEKFNGSLSQYSIEMAVNTS